MCFEAHVDYYIFLFYFHVIGFITVYIISHTFQSRTTHTLLLCIVLVHLINSAPTRNKIVMHGIPWTGIYDVIQPSEKFRNKFFYIKMPEGF